MYLAELRGIFIHIPKTAGNFLQNALRIHSSDKFTSNDRQDGVERFGVEGVFTSSKHAPLEQYRQAMPADLFSQLQIITAIRHPVTRLLSLYYSPHANLKLTARARLNKRLAGLLRRPFTPGRDSFVPQQPKFAKPRFERLIAKTPLMRDYLSVDGQFVMPKHVIRYERLQDDVTRVFSELDIAAPGDWTPRNQSTGKEMVERLAQDEEIITMVKRHHAADFEIFGYQ